MRTAEYTEVNLMETVGEGDGNRTGQDYTWHWTSWKVSTKVSHVLMETVGEGDGTGRRK